jgi:hypothetical protein
MDDITFTSRLANALQTAAKSISKIAEGEAKASLKVA